MRWLGGAKVLGKLSVLGRPTSLVDSRARAYCACSRCGWGMFGHFSLIYLFSFLSPSLWTFLLSSVLSSLSPSLWETARYRLKYCLKGPLNPKQPNNSQPLDLIWIRGWSGGAMVLGKLPIPGRPTSLDKSRARAYCACNRCGWGLFGHFYSRLSFLFSFSLSLGDGPI